MTPTKHTTKKATQKSYLPVSEKKALANLVAIFQLATAADLNEGVFWYRVAHNECLEVAQRQSITIEQVCGCVAALSPALRWEKNISSAESLISAYKAGTPLPVVGVYGKLPVRKCLAILEGGEPFTTLGKSATKTRSFYQNLLNPRDVIPVAIDRHAKCAALGEKSGKNSIVRPSEYEPLADIYRKAAEAVNLIPCEFQAVVWTVWRRKNGNIAQSEFIFD